MMTLRLALCAAALLGISFIFPLVTKASGLSGIEDVRQERRLEFYNTHTHENLNLVYWRDGRMLPEALEQAETFLRDHRNGHVHTVSPDLLNLLFDLRSALEREHPGQDIVFNVISGYRSPETNAMLRAAGGRQAKNSRHMHGDAIDIRIPGIPVVEIRDAAWCLQRGGVGYYKGSDFVHVDTDRVRFWHWKPRPGLCDPYRGS